MKERVYRESLPIRGKQLSSEQIERVQRTLKDARTESKKPLLHEREKTPELLFQIQLINEMLEAELADLGVKGFKLILPEQVHYLEESEFRAYRKYEAKNVEGSYKDSEDSIHILYDPERDGNPFSEEIDWNSLSDQVTDEMSEKAGSRPDDEQSKKYQAWEKKFDALWDERWSWLEQMEEETPSAVHFYSLFKVTLHEAIHAVGAQQANVVGEGFGMRGGYHLVSPEGEGFKEYFVALNEATVERMTLELVKKHQATIEKGTIAIAELEAFKEACESYDGAGVLHPFIDGAFEPADLITEGSYEFEREILELILQKVAEQKGEPIEATWKRFKEGYVSGSLMHLREIEGAFGPGALRIYANIEPIDHDDIHREQQEERIRMFFSSSDEDTRTRIGIEILDGKGDEIKAFLRRLESGGKKKKEK